MAITANAMMMGARGSVGKQIVFKKYGDKTVIAKVPDFSKRKLSEKQLRNNEIMTYAHFYASGTMANEELANAAQLRLNVQRNKLYTSLIREYYKNNYEKEQISTTKPAATPAPASAPNIPFINYLLDNTDKSVEEIAQLTGAPVDVVKVVRNTKSAL